MSEAGSGREGAARTGRRAALALACIAALAIAPAAAPADGGSKSRISIKRLEPSGAAGRVTSGNERCLAKRKVSLFRLIDFRSDKIEITYSNERGRWRTKKDLSDGLYFAKVDATKGCRYAVSRNRRL